MVELSDMKYSVDDSQFSSVKSTKKRKGSGKGNKRRSGLSREKSDNNDHDSTESAEFLRNYQHLSEDQTPCSASETRVKEETSTNMFAGVLLETTMNKCRFLDKVVGLNLRTVVLHLFRAAALWLEQLKPKFRVITSLISSGHKYVRIKIDHAYPIIWTWALRFSQLIFLLSMVWLDCIIRGFDSLLHLEAISLLTVVWCTMLSVTAMIGLMKMLVVMIISVLLVVFIGVGVAILVIVALGIVIFCLYCSFWTTGTVFLLGGVSFFSGHERVSFLVSTLYSMYCARSYVGWLGLLSGLNLAFISGDLLVYFLKNIQIDSSEQARRTNSDASHSFGESSHPPLGDDNFYSVSADRGPGFPSTSGAESELTSEDEVVRLLSSTDHYSALGFSRYASIDASQLKREYRKKAMLVHPDKNMGNEKAAEAFKRLQNAYEVLLDSLKRKAYDDDLRREELLNYFKRFQSASQKKGGRGIFRPGPSTSEAEYEGPFSESRKIACKKCSGFHIWGCTMRSKSQARWCQDCNEFHQSKDGDGWVEQTSQPLLFGLFRKMDSSQAYVCAESRIYNVTEWFICQGMRCPANTHKPSFHVNASLMKQATSKGSSSGTTRGGGGMPDETMTEEEIFEWLHNTFQSGGFEPSTQNESGFPSQDSSSKSNGKKKRKGKKQW